MVAAHGRTRHRLALGAVLAIVLMAAIRSAFALNPALDVSQYAHAVWRTREGFSRGAIHIAAQTPDGFLWLGTEFGLLRFDGVSASPWQPPPDQHLPSSEIRTLLVGRDGTLWIGSAKGLASWKDGKLKQYPQLAGQGIFGLVEDRDGVIWAGGWAVFKGKLCTVQNEDVQCPGDFGVSDIHEDSRGNLWVGTGSGLWRWKPAPSRFFSTPGQPLGIQGLSEDDDGALLMSRKGILTRFVDGKEQPFRQLPGSGSIRRLFRDRDGSLWIGTAGQGLIHLHEGRTDVYTRSDGLSGNDVVGFFQDREGSIWVATLDGLDRFRDFAVATVSVDQGLSSDRVMSVLGARDGSIWVRTLDGLNRWNRGKITIYRGSGRRATPEAQARRTVPPAAREVVVSGLPEEGIGSLFEDGEGRIWVSSTRAVGYLENEQFHPVSGVPGGRVHSIVGDAQGNLWLAHEARGLYHLFQGSVVEEIPWARLAHDDFADSLALDSGGGLWLGFFRGGLMYFKDGKVRASYVTSREMAEGLGGRVTDVRLDGDGAVWAATIHGLSRLKNGKLATLNRKSGLPCDVVHWATEDAAHSLWLYMPCGLVHIARSELEAWIAAANTNRAAEQKIQATVFDTSDGVRSRANAGGFSPHSAESGDGKLWFFSLDGLSVIDPGHLPFNRLPPPVQIEQITVDGKTYDAPFATDGRLRLPPLARDLEIDYTGLSFAAPEKIRFRYKLEGHDRDWQDAGNRRQAFYNNLSPRDYRFRVMASNNSGVWNEAGASLLLSIAPAYYQTTWFFLSCVAAVLGLLGVTHRLRVLYLARQFNLRLEERVNERTRIARDLHDTLLQSFQGVLLKFSALKYVIRDRPGEAEETLERAVDQARQAITEGRDAVQGLRSSVAVSNDLARAIKFFAEQLAAEESGENTCEFDVRVEGESRDLHPVIRDEVYRIAGEALRNAFRHACARRIEVEIHYDKRQLRLQVRDNGKGIDPKVLSEGGRTGHHGLPGMRERADLIGGRLAVWSEVDSGAVVELTVPAAVAYAKTPAAHS